MNTDLNRIKKLLKQGKPMIWLFSGDSITQGAKHTYGFRSYPEIFSERIRWEMKRSNDFIINTGINGSTTSTILNNFKWNISQFQPSIVFLMFGINDCQSIDTIPSTFSENISSLIDRIRMNGAITVLQTPNCINEEEVTKYNYKSREKLSKYVSHIQRIAEIKDVVLIDHWSYWAKQDYTNWLDDPLHPNIKGHIEIARLIFTEFSIFDSKAFAYLDNNE